METIDDARWEQIEARRRDDTFRFGVRSTGIYCRSGCPSRTPVRRNVVAFPDAPEARAAGFRACKRCAPDDGAPDAEAVRTIERAAALLSSDDPPSLGDAARAVGLSRFHFQRLFRRITGVTPGEFARALRAERLRERLRAGARVSDAIYDAGFGSPSRVYGEGVLGMTPGSVRSGGRGEQIAYAIAPSSLGRVLVATSARGVCAIELGDDDDALVAELAASFPNAERTRDDGALAATLAQVVALVDDPAVPVDLTLDVRGTAFQRRVWNALRGLAPGEPATYGAIARAIGNPHAAQAVGAACAANRLAVAIPCHRVVREDGDAAGYRWGVARKRELLRREADARAERARRANVRSSTDEIDALSSDRPERRATRA
ncbi:bifunctional DNA-binding transcriptional regulator/O6-methylguanine-DNA methyltransferase Ada [Vulcanimicrobium alpinum]|nr:bifunctional DNA-binding transcriptional regulator/O6-methylguanine-DNA methyltransferase Ada [Vulcanimicrobium alpinum]